jgi:hypothetical protein
VLVVLDVTSGAARELTSTPDGYAAVEWRPDGAALRAIKVEEGPPRRWSVVEVDLDGAERSLRDLSAEFPGVTGATLNDDVVVVGVRVGQGMDRFLVPLDGGAARRLPDPGLEGGVAATAVGGVRGNRLALPIGDPVGGYPTIRIIPTTGDSIRTVRAPFGSLNRRVSRDGEQLIVTGRAAGTSTHQLYRVSLNDGTQRLIGDIEGSGDGGPLAPSPDGRFVAYTVDGTYTSTLHEIDFGPVLQAIPRR